MLVLFSAEIYRTVVIVTTFAKSFGQTLAASSKRPPWVKDLTFIGFWTPTLSKAIGHILALATNLVRLEMPAWAGALFSDSLILPILRILKITHYSDSNAPVLVGVLDSFLGRHQAITHLDLGLLNHHIISNIDLPNILVIQASDRANLFPLLEPTSKTVSIHIYLTVVDRLDPILAHHSSKSSAHFSSCAEPLSSDQVIWAHGPATFMVHYLLRAHSYAASEVYIVDNRGACQVSEPESFRIEHSSYLRLGAAAINGGLLPSLLPNSKRMFFLPISIKKKVDRRQVSRVDALTASAILALFGVMDKLGTSREQG
ncbi:hypothetical protein C8J56DRAFT_886895 [Mycena floridula]|nr:hypothetical protein C8J56DRAFT_886895 [Mycena floridula]